MPPEAMAMMHGIPITKLISSIPSPPVGAKKTVVLPKPSQSLSMPGWAANTPRLNK